MKKLLFLAAALLIALAAGWASAPAPAPQSAATVAVQPAQPAALAALRLARERQTVAAALLADAGLADAGLAADGGVAPRLVRISGLVEKDGLPSAATVHLGAATLATTDGAFEWEGSVAGDVTVWAERGPLRSRAWVASPPDERSTWVRLRLVEPSRVVGRVVDAEQRPVPKAKVTIDEAPGESSLADGDGRFRFEQVPPGPTEVTATAAGFATAVRPLLVEAGRENELEVTLDRFGLVDANLVVVSDENGGFRLGPLSPGTDKVMLLELVGEGPAAQLIEFTIKEGETQRLDLGGEANAGVVLRWREPAAGQKSVRLPVVAAAVRQVEAVAADLAVSA